MLVGLPAGKLPMPWHCRQRSRVLVPPSPFSSTGPGVTAPLGSEVVTSPNQMRPNEFSLPCDLWQEKHDGVIVVVFVRSHLPVPSISFTRWLTPPIVRAALKYWPKLALGMSTPAVG